jgi:hypothetical protein
MAALPESNRAARVFDQNREQTDLSATVLIEEFDIIQNLRFIKHNYSY